ncbi:MAG: hypothetical protein HY336_01275 [Candidatus Doudnabacteria bacterium]|nr:hypothetical protein [Candidatus Doudnabacteria bacterium]
MDETNQQTPPNTQPQIPPPQPVGQSNNTLMAVLAYLGVLIIIPFLTEAHKDPFVKFHLKQGLALVILEVISWFVWIVPVLGWLIGWLLWLFIIVMIIMGIMNVASGKMKELPILGEIAKKFNF